MYIHLGDDCCVRESSIIAVLDLDTSTQSKHTREFLATAEEEGFITVVSDDIPKAAVVCETGHKSKIYFCTVASSTIRKRFGKGGYDFE